VSSVNHETVPVHVWADIDVGIAAHVSWLNSLEGARTFTSCQGTIGEGGPEPYEPYITAWWPPEHDAAIRERFHLIVEGNGWRTIRPKAGEACPGK
jgi:hypothetical protein